MQSQQFFVPLNVRNKYHLALRHGETQNVYKDVLFYERVNQIRFVTGRESSRRSETEHINVISVSKSVFEMFFFTLGNMIDYFQV
jgi:hypothetical protein